MKTSSFLKKNAWGLVIFIGLSNLSKPKYYPNLTFYYIEYQ